MSVFSFFVILPLNFTGGENNTDSNVKEYMGKLFFTDFMKFTMAYVSFGSPRLWVHCVAAYLLTGIVVRELLVEYNAFNNIRHRYLLSRESHLRTVLVTNIPRHMRAPSKITNYFKHVYPEAVKSVTVCQNLIKLEYLVKKRKTVISKIERELLKLCLQEKRKLVGLNIFERLAQIFCTTFVCQWLNCIDSAHERLANQYERLEEFNRDIRNEMKRRQKVMRKLDRMEAGPGSSDIDYILASPFIGEPLPCGRPEEKVMCHAAALPPCVGAPRNPDGSLATPRRAFDYNTVNERKHVSDPSEASLDVAAFPPGESNGQKAPSFPRARSALQRYSRLVRGKVSAAVWPLSIMDSQRLEFNGQETLENHTNEVCDKAFIVMRTFTASTIAIQSMHSSKPGSMRVQTAPEPRDILWDNIYVSKGAKRTRRYLADIFVHVLIFFYIVPVALVSMVLSEQALVAFSPRLEQLDQASAFFASSIAMVQPLSLVAIQQILPPLFMQVYKAEGILSFSEVQMKVFSRYFLFQVINVFLVTAIAGSIFDTMAIIISRPEIALELLGASLPKMASFFITYVTMKTFLGLGVELVRIMSLLQGTVRSLLCPRATLREKRSVMVGMRAIDDPGWFPFHKILAQDMLVIVIAVVYAVLAPLVLIPCALFCLFSRLLWTHHHLYVYESVFETGGMFWPKIFRRFVFGLIIAQATIAGQLIVKNAKHEAYAVIALMGLTYGFLRSTRARYDNTSSTLPLEVATVMDISVSQEEERRKWKNTKEQIAYDADGLTGRKAYGQLVNTPYPSWGTGKHTVQFTANPDSEKLDGDDHLVGDYDPFEDAYIQPSLRANPHARPEQPFPPEQLGKETGSFQEEEEGRGKSATVRMRGCNEKDRDYFDKWWADQILISGEQQMWNIITGEESGTLLIGRNASPGMSTTHLNSKQFC
eukprot:CAMPEP_0113300316 /NCGR_PEP_ID=MMETSP0010_2-20120614/1999_1 /TAXON_ID=216773 ORGANISM="Corethron hystrix, Strain 308" /NCGR_SAMPLE_ID=MMETSP0010_2 /ASSEMBLY_ACC=CAM_ASM_000155 /LENGTH=932 /DNA_ID=CAMNT_0000153725 /DNA_START=157 /DNA_END=2955 /DNA_ORIENTATION=- /assembly_acc=CAM_ASM_000155